MNVKLSALALGITLAYGMLSAAMAAEATIEQTGGASSAVINQYNNDGSAVEATITTSGWDNTHSIDQTRSNRIWAEINSPGSGNTASIEQSRLDYAGAHIYQAAHGSDASIRQGSNSGMSPTFYPGYGWGGGNRDNSQWAHIYQNGGWGHDASIVQRGDRVKATIEQSGFYNTALVDQRGTGAAFNETEITQSGTGQYTSVTQNGHDLMARVNQSGLGNVALVDQSGNGHTARVTQSGAFNFAQVTQSN